MKVCSVLVALCVLQNSIREAQAFLVPAPKTQPSSSTALSSDRGYQTAERSSFNRDYSTSVRDYAPDIADATSAPLVRYGDTRPSTAFGDIRPSTFRGDSYRQSHPASPYHDHRTSSAPPGYNPIQGGSRETWSNRHSFYGDDQMQVSLQSDGRPLDADVELFDGPDNTPQRVRVYSEDGWMRPFRTIMETPLGSGGQNAVSIRNSGPMAFPMAANVEGSSSRQGYGGGGMGSRPSRFPGQTVQGGSLKTFPFYDPSIQSVEVSIQTEGLPLMAVVEVWQGPNSVKQIAEIYTQDGMSRPFRAIVETPGYGSTIAVRNTGPMEFPITARVDPIGGGYPFHRIHGG